ETLTLHMPMGTDVEISPILGTEPLAARQLQADIDPTLPCEVYDTAGRLLGTTSTAALPQGIYILRQGNAVRKISVK
ncbi:MAG: T9SS type A sorting domain-containing protein, partial [Muribaculaceae bacterium]|nr:T9SS type A sorting domain-containing protein [Muribaculaceae bacterium]